jgi:hypothetical protein
MSVLNRSVDGNTGAASLSDHCLLACHVRALKSTGQPKKATPKGTPTFFPVLLTALALWYSGQPQPSSWASLRSLTPGTLALSRGRKTNQPATQPSRTPITPLIPRGPETPLTSGFSPIDNPFHNS